MPTSKTSLNPEVVEELARIVGVEYVHLDRETRNRYGRSTGPERTEPIGIVAPCDREQVQAIVRLASRAGVALFPISCGKNWGYGDACAPRSDNLIVDLSRMNRILEVNTELAYAVVEPGVTQGQLVDYIEAHALPLMIDATGAGRGASVVGNVLERGSGHTPYGDHFQTSCNYEIVLSDGSIIESGFGAYSNSQAQHVFKYGVGPSLDGLFSQSNFGIITRMTVWLMPTPENFCMFFVSLEDADSVGPFFETVRRLRLSGTLKSTLHCFNNRRLLSSAARFPWEKARGDRALEVEHPDMFREMCEKYGIPAWAATGSVQGSNAEVAAARKIIRRTLGSTRGVARLVFLTERSFAFVQLLRPWLRRLAPSSLTLRRLDQVNLGWELLRGQPSNDTLKGSHWRSKAALTAEIVDPLDSHSGLAWVSPILPMTAAAVTEVSRSSEHVFHKYGFEYQATLTAINERALIAVQSISFDRSNVDETVRARQCQDELLETLLSRGYVPYRGPLSVMERVWPRAPSYWTVVASLKAALDPGAIIAPDRYVPTTVHNK